MQNILITGGNAGIGKATAIELAKNDNRIVILGRNQSKVNKAVADIKSITGNSEIYSLLADLSSFQSINKSTEQYESQFGKLDILINNAGVVTNKYQLTKDGYELQIGVNHLGHFLLTTNLIDLISTSDNPRIINVSSNAHFRGQIDFDTFSGSHQPDFKGMKAYSQSKLANVLFTKELAIKYPKITSHSLHPGVVKTDIAKKNNNSWLWQSMWKMAKPLMMTPAKGARTSVYLAESSEVLNVNGQYYKNRKVIEPALLASDHNLSEQLWEYSIDAINN